MTTLWGFCALSTNKRRPSRIRIYRGDTLVTHDLVPPGQWLVRDMGLVGGIRGRVRFEIRGARVHRHLAGEIGVHP